MLVRYVVASCQLATKTCVAGAPWWWQEILLHPPRPVSDDTGFLRDTERNMRLHSAYMDMLEALARLCPIVCVTVNSDLEVKLFSPETSFNVHVGVFNAPYNLDLRIFADVFRGLSRNMTIKATSYFEQSCRQRACFFISSVPQREVKANTKIMQERISIVSPARCFFSFVSRCIQITVLHFLPLLSFLFFGAGPHRPC